MATARIGIAGRDHVSVPGIGHARAHDRCAVDPDQAVEALADAAVDRTRAAEPAGAAETAHARIPERGADRLARGELDRPVAEPEAARRVSHGRPDRKSTRLNSSHLGISYAVFCLKKK